MCSFFCFAKFILGSSHHYFVAVLYKMEDHILEIEHLRTSFNQCDIINAETGLKGSMFIKRIQDNIWNGVPFKYIHNSHPVSVRFITNTRNTFYLPIID